MNTETIKERIEKAMARYEEGQRRRQSKRFSRTRGKRFSSEGSDLRGLLPIRREHAARSRVEFHRRTGVMEKTVDLLKINGLLHEAATPFPKE